MIAAILCPGPSLARTCPPFEELGMFDVVVAVNRAILHEGASRFVHWHACGDWDTLLAISCPPKTGICTMRDAARVIQAGSHAQQFAGLRWAMWEELPVQPGYSTIAALALVYILGASEITVFGDDKQGLLDWDGKPGRERRDSRWDRERELQQRAVAKLKLSVTYR